MSMGFNGCQRIATDLGQRANDPQQKLPGREVGGEREEQGDPLPKVLRVVSCKNLSGKWDGNAKHRMNAWTALSRDERLIH